MALLPEDLQQMIGNGRAMSHVVQLLRRVAPHARTALITGETGTGKELAARALHGLGPRRGEPLVTVNCSALVDTLFESELFGHVRGAFTGATDHKPGLLEVADGGTLFLDEVGELPPGAQAKLLRVLEDGEIQRVGSVQPRRVDVHVIAATNRALEAEVEGGRFRRDLFYRLDVVRIHLPPLRERREDIPALVDAFVSRFADRSGRRLDGFSNEAIGLLEAAVWDGNVRQLRNVVERACIMTSGPRIEADDVRLSLEPAAVGPAPWPSSGGEVVVMASRARRRLDEVERDHIVRTLADAKGNKAVAARVLGISRRAFYRQLERHGLHSRMRDGGPACPPALGRAS